jgi:hypothetical protein
MALEMVKGPAGARLHFSVSSVFSWVEGRFLETSREVQAAALGRLLRRQWGVKPEPEHPALRWRLGCAFDGVDGSGSAFRQRRWTRLALERCTIGIAFGALQHG